MQPLPFLAVLLAIPAAILVAVNTEGELQWLRFKGMAFLFSGWARLGFLLYGGLVSWFENPLTPAIAFLLLFLWSLFGVAHSPKQSWKQHLKQQFSLAGSYLFGLLVFYIS